jgi:hypothetical protein
MVTAYARIMVEAFRSLRDKTIGCDGKHSKEQH